MSRTLFDQDDDTDPGPDGMEQLRLPVAGFVRLVENPTPCFELPRRTVDYQARRHDLCGYCRTYRTIWVWSGCCDRCTDEVFR